MADMTHDEERQARRDAYVRASQHRIWRITAVACLALLGLGFGVAAVLQSSAHASIERKRDAQLQAAQAELLERQRADIACVKRWADTYTKRADRIGTLNQPKSDALDRLVASIPAHNAALFDKRLREYLAASRIARVNSQENPLPPSPVFACGLDPSAGPSAFRPQSSPPATISTPRRSATRRPRPTSTPAAAPQPSPPPGGRVVPGSGTRRVAPVRHDRTTPPPDDGAGGHPSTSPARPGLLPGLTAPVCQLVPLLC